ncbi:MAG: FlhC family transcriptional regulator [Pseudomonadota bacterium]|nr:FlhC family transcriptional regulator [Pseudomonadota bacterium]
MRLDLHARTDLAIALIRRRMRTSIVRKITGIHPVILRELHHEIHGCKPVSGQLPSSNGILHTPLTQASASVFAALYRSFGGADIHKAVDVDALVKAHDLYVDQFGGLSSSGRPGVPVDITQAWIIARDLTTRIARSQFCDRCQVHYLIADLPRTPPTCPICVLKRAHPSSGSRKRRAA